MPRWNDADQAAEIGRSGHTRASLKMFRRATKLYQGRRGHSKTNVRGQKVFIDVEIVLKPLGRA